MREVRVLFDRYLIDCTSVCAGTQGITSVVEWGIIARMMWLIQLPFKRPECTLTQQVCLRVGGGTGCTRRVGGREGMNARAGWVRDSKWANFPVPTHASLKLLECSTFGILHRFSYLRIYCILYLNDSWWEILLVSYCSQTQTLRSNWNSLL